jgi:hypothetical protein
MNDILFCLKPYLNRELFGESESEEVWLNLNGDYTYMTEGYYMSLDAEMEGRKVVPTTKEALDAYVAPLALEKAALAGIPVLDHQVVNIPANIKPHIIAHPINPVTSGGEIILSDEEMEPKIKRVTLSGKCAASIQRLPDNFRIDTVRCVMGKTLLKEYEAFASSIFRVFRLPLMKVKVVVTPQQYILSSIEPLEYDSLTLNEKKLIEGMGVWRE